MARVLRAELEAVASVDAARAQAEHLAEDARARVREIAERARVRIARGQAAVDLWMQEERARIDAAARALRAHGDPEAADQERLEAAVQALAASLTGGTTEPR